MKFSNKIKCALFAQLILLNIILRLQTVPREIGDDSFVMHIMVNSLSEYGYATWFLHPLSLAGLYPYSYASSMQFLLSSICQSTNMDVNFGIFLYCVFIGLFSMFTGYLMAGAIIDDDLFKILVAFGFSTAPAVLGYTTWTLPTRGLLIVLTPLLVYLLLKCRISSKYIILSIVLSVLLVATHHLVYFLLPPFIAFFILVILFRLSRYIKFIEIPKKVNFLIPITGFLIMFSIPFFTGKFIEQSRYAPIDIAYTRYIGVMIIFTIAGIFYLVFKQNKNFSEWFLLLSAISLTPFIYKLTYMKMFSPIFAIPLASISLRNVVQASERQKHALSLVTVFLLMSTSFVGYYQFLHMYSVSPYNERYIEDSTYNTGLWMKNNLDGKAVSNDALFSHRIFSVSDTTHLLTSSTLIDQIYGFISANISLYERYPYTSEDFWISGYKGPDLGEALWHDIVQLRKSPSEFEIEYVVENMKGYGNIIWNHGIVSSKLISVAHEKDCVYDCGNARVWWDLE